MSEKSDYLKSYIGKSCKIDMTAWYAPFSGTIVECENDWITLETRGKTELINIDRINRIVIKK